LIFKNRVVILFLLCAQCEVSDSKKNEVHKHKNQFKMENRYYYIDRLKVFLICLIVFHQTLIAYGGIGLWYYTSADSFTGTALIAVNTIKTVNLSFLASLFFLISAMLAHTSYQKWGFREFVKRRLVRLGVPLLVYAVLFHPTVVYFIARSNGMPPGWLSFVREQLTTNFTLGPMWFVATLLAMELGYAIYKKYCPSIDPLLSELWKQTAALRATLFVAALGIINFVVRLASPARAIQPGIQWGFYPVYVGMFISGLIAQRNDWIHKLKIGFSLPWLLFGLLCLPMLLLSVHHIGDWSIFTGGLNTQSLLYALWEPMICAGMNFFLMSVFFRFFNSQSERAVVLSNLVYIVYFICPAVIVPLTKLFEPMALPVFFKWLFTAILSTVICFAVAYLLRKIALLLKKSFKILFKQ